MLKNYVTNEVGTLRKILIHSPDGGIGKIIPSKFQDWLYDDTVHLRKMQAEYDDYVMLLLYFLDPDKAQYITDFQAEKADEPLHLRDVFKPDLPQYFNSDRVIDVQKALSDILANELVRIRLVSAICAVEGCNQQIQKELEQLSPPALAKTLISGIMLKEEEEVFIFPPTPNLVFTRDIGIMIKDHILLSKTAKQARKRESLITHYIALYHPDFFANHNERVIEVTEESDFFLEEEDIQEKKVITIEGGDIMMIAPHHLIVGCSERTSKSAVNAIIHEIFSRPALEIEKISVVQIPPVRAHMHIDTVFTQVKRNAWVMYDGYSEKLNAERDSQKKDYAQRLSGDDFSLPNHQKVRVLQFYKQKYQPYEPSKDYFRAELAGLEELFTRISVEDFGVKKKEVKIIYSANGIFPYNEREQWTDSCNVVALREGVVIGYDRNELTIEAFKNKEYGLGFDIIHARDLLPKIASGEVNPAEMKDTLILLASAELSRARGGSHCMSMPLHRERF